MEAQMKQLIAERGTIKARLTMFKNFVESSANDTDLIALERRLQVNEGLYTKFDSVQTKIELLTVNTELEELHSTERENFETVYFNTMASLEKCIKNLRGLSQPTVSNATNPSPTVTESVTTPKLPTIVLPTFDGTYDKWLRFRDTFQSLIHNNDQLSDIQRFHYLNSTLKGSAARTIESLGVSEVNYKIAWQSLKGGYEDPQALTRHHANALIELQPLKNPSGSALREFVDTIQNHIMALGALGQSVNTWDTLVVLVIAKKLDSATNIEWEKRLLQLHGHLKLQEFIDFLEQRARFLERISSNKLVIKSPSSNNTVDLNRLRNRNQVAVSSHVASTPNRCLLCKGEHFLYQCKDLQAIPHAKIFETVKHLQCCFNCLQLGHSSKTCTRGTCRKCGGKHNTILHRENNTSSVNNVSSGNLSPRHVSSSQSSSGNSSTNSSSIIKSHESTALTITTTPSLQSCLLNSQSTVTDYTVLSTALVYVETGSQAHFISEQFLDRLNLSRTNVNVTVGGLGKVTNPISTRTQVVLHSRIGSFHSNLSCFVLQNITDDIPNVPLNRESLNIPPGISLADPRFDAPKRIDLLIGAALFWQLLCVGQHKASTDLVWQKTRLGWVLGGNLKWPRNSPVRNINTFHTITYENLEQALTRFWDIEDNTKHDQKIDYVDDCEKHFLDTTTRNVDRRFIVSIPFNHNISKLGTSREQAKNRLLSLERKFAKQPTLREQYAKFMTEYEQLGHMSRVTDSTDVLDSNYYFPHHAVFKTTSTTTKIRVVFDGSAKTSSGVSLNEAQLVGPTVQNDLFSILIRFRKHNIVLSADIEKMYRQILVRSEDRKFQQIVWRSNPELPISTFELNTITYGTASAPYLATRVLVELGRKHLDKHPVAAKVIINDFYVDDLLTGCETITEARQLRDELTQILDQAGFLLRKWATNSKDLLTRSNELQNEIEFHTTDKDPKTLGLLWSIGADTLKYSLKGYSNASITKRAILSQIAQIFDPLGLIGPVIVRAKLIMQELWQLQIGWDETLPQVLYTQWCRFRDELNDVSLMNIPRRVLCVDAKIIELHGFSDASERAYGACVYLRSLQKNGTWFIRLLCPKSRVAPIKFKSLPCLELCAALLLAQLSNKVIQSLQINITREYYWSDSMITLAWIRSSPAKWETFIANRTSQIHQLTSPENWNHVPGVENPADIISRGASSRNIAENSLWWFGPQWLSQEITQCPSIEIVDENIPGERRTRIKCLAALNKSKKEFDIFTRYSSYSHLRRIVAYCIRFLEILLNRIRNRGTRSTSPTNTRHLNTDELVKSEQILVKIAQLEEFSNEIQLLALNKNLDKKNRLLSLNPFLDDKGILRVGGRLTNAPVPYNHRHPMILPASHPLTKLIIDHEHRRLLHAGCQHTLASIRTRFWPISGKHVVKRVLHRCIQCFKTNPISTSHIMGNFPAARVTPARAFSTCGIDYAGPLIIKEKGRSRITHKTYICLFVCFATKAIHIELATDLSTDAFLNCLYRFISRRGRSQIIYSDNGTNFIGARNELNELGILLTNKAHNSRVKTLLSEEQIEWHLIPPHSPRFGGLWESAVKSVKRHLKRVIGEQRLTFEELYTVLTQIEACLNSRPLHPISNDLSDLTPLTPGHFLIGAPITALPQSDLLHLKHNRLNRYQLIQFMVQDFWKQWQREYLHELQQRCKWKTKSPNTIAIDALVIIRKDNLPPLRWKLGRIVELHPGTDGVVRVASVKTADGIIKRPVVKLCLLPVTDSNYNYML